MSLNKSPHDVIIRPIVSEKSYGRIDANGQYTFEVQPTANKTEIKLAIEQVFGVKIEDEAAGLKAFKSVEALTDFIAGHAKA